MTEKKNLFLRIDNAFMVVTRAFSWISPIVLVVMALLATVNVILAKIFTFTIPGNVYWITYLLVPVIFFAVSHEQLYRGMSYVDIFTTRFPWWLNMIIQVISTVGGGLIFALFGCTNISKLTDAFRFKTLSEANTGGFLLWPFYLILVAMCFLLALTFFWSAVRSIYYKANIPYSGAANPDVLPEEEKEGVEQL